MVWHTHCLALYFVRAEFIIGRPTCAACVTDTREWVDLSWADSNYPTTPTYHQLRLQALQELMDAAVEHKYTYAGIYGNTHYDGGLRVELDEKQMSNVFDQAWKLYNGALVRKGAQAVFVEDEFAATFMRTLQSTVSMLKASGGSGYVLRDTSASGWRSPNPSGRGV
jgi:hypothetical protein